MNTEQLQIKEGSLEYYKAKAEFFEEQHNDLANMLANVMQMCELAFGCLWMIDTEHPAHWAARKALKDAFIVGDNTHNDLLQKECIRRGIKAAIDAGFEADHPEGATWWAGKKGGDDE